jgi:hypothetical protein
LFQLKATPISELQNSAMELIWADFYKSVLGPAQTRENEAHPGNCTMFSCYHKRVEGVKTAAQEMHEWEDYAMRRYKAPAEPYKSIAEQLA